MAMPNDAGEHHGEPAAASDAIPADAAPAIEATAISSSIVNDSAREEPIKSEAPSAQPEAAKSPSGLPRAAVLAFRPDERPGAPGPDAEAAVRTSSRAGGRRFALLAAGLTIAAAIGAVAGSAGMAGVERLFVSKAPAAAPAPAPAPAIAYRHESGDEVRVLKE